MTEKDFKKLVKEAITALPEKIRDKMDNLAVVIEKRPSSYELERAGKTRGDFLLGLYQGVPKITWARDHRIRLPDKITIFQDSIEKIASSPEQIKELVKITVWHEIAHHFGFNESRVQKLQAKWRRLKSF